MHPPANTRLCKHCEQLPSVKWEMDLMLQVIMLCCISHKVCREGRVEGEKEGAIFFFQLEARWPHHVREPL